MPEKKDKGVYEIEVFAEFLERRGYTSSDDYNSLISDYELEYPLSPYMIANTMSKDQKEIEWTAKTDVMIQIFGSKEYMSRYGKKE